MSEQHFSTPQPIELSVRIPAGEIEVNTTDGEETTVRLAGAPRMLEAVHVELADDRLVIEQRKRSVIEWFGRGDEALQVQVELPHRSRVKVATASADARLEGTFAGVEMKSASGEVTVSGELDGNAVVKTVSGDARLTRVTGDLTAKSVSGDVTAQVVEGSVSVSSVSGDLRVGSVRQGNVNVQSVSGDVELGVAAGTSIDIDAGTASGSLTSEVPLSDMPTGEPGPTLVIRGSTVSGDIRVLRAA